jgi:hypothetical protein
VLTPIGTEKKVPKTKANKVPIYNKTLFIVYGSMGSSGLICKASFKG